MKAQVIAVLCSFWLAAAAWAEIIFTPAEPALEVNAQINLTVAGTTGNVIWTAVKGRVVGNGTEAVYTAMVSFLSIGTTYS